VGCLPGDDTQLVWDSRDVDGPEDVHNATICVASSRLSIALLAEMPRTCVCVCCK
jgi:hypothetical protein